MYDDYAVEPDDDELDEGILDGDDGDEDGNGGGSGAEPAGEVGLAGGADVQVESDAVAEVHGDIDVDRFNYVSMMADEDYHANEDKDTSQQRGWKRIDDNTVRVEVNGSLRKQWGRALEEMPRLQEHLRAKARAVSTRQVHRNKLLQRTNSKCSERSCVSVSPTAS